MKTYINSVRSIQFCYGIDYLWFSDWPLPQKQCHDNDEISSYGIGVLTRANTTGCSLSMVTINISPDCANSPVSAEIFTWWDTNILGLSSSATHWTSDCLRARVCSGSVLLSWKKELIIGTGIGSPKSSRRAVSRQRHHWLERMVAVSMPLSRSTSPMALAWVRPSSDNFRWVEQSSTTKCCGSPMPGANAWRIKPTALPCFSMDQAFAVCCWVLSAL